MKKGPQMQWDGSEQIWGGSVTVMRTRDIAFTPSFDMLPAFTPFAYSLPPDIHSLRLFAPFPYSLPSHIHWAVASDLYLHIEGLQNSLLFSSFPP